MDRMDAKVRKKMGRPPAVGVARSCRVEIRLAPEELERVKLAADDAGLEISEYIRRRIFGGVQKSVPQISPGV